MTLTTRLRIAPACTKIIILDLRADTSGQWVVIAISLGMYNCTGWIADTKSRVIESTFEHFNIKLFNYVDVECTSVVLWHPKQLGVLIDVILTYPGINVYDLTTTIDAW